MSAKIVNFVGFKSNIIMKKIIYGIAILAMVASCMSSCASRSGKKAAAEAELSDSTKIAMEMENQLFEEVEGEYPYYWIVEKFYELGGYLVTLSSDAHDPKSVGKNYEHRIQMLKKAGFTHMLYYKDRKAMPCSL